MSATIDLSGVHGAETILRGLSLDEWRRIPPGNRRNTHMLRRYGLIERTTNSHGNIYRLTASGVDHAAQLSPVPTRAQRLAMALCASGRIDTGDGVCAGVCVGRPCPHVQEVHHAWAVSLLAGAS